jgi:hypothetical protein
LTQPAPLPVIAAAPGGARKFLTSNGFCSGTAPL